MTFASDQLTVVIILFIFVILISLVVKQFIKIAIAVALILVIFKLGFILTGTESNLFKAEKEIKETASALETQELYDALLDGVGDTIKGLKDKTIEVDYDKLSMMIADSLIKINQQNIEDEQLSKIISEEFKSFNSEEINMIVNKTRQALNEIEAQ